MRLDAWKFEVSRRGLLGGLSTSLLLLARRSVPAAETGGVEPVVRVGSVQGGTLSWLLDEIAALGLDRAAGVRIEAVPTPGFADAALREGHVDVIVSDWFWVSRERSENLADWTFSPFSVANGSLVVPSGSDLHNLNDIRGRHIGVVGTSHDQGWSILRLAARRSGWDILEDAHPEFGPPPVIASRFEKGDFDAALLIWSWAALLEARGKCRQILSVGDLLRSFGFTTDLPLLGYVFSERWAKANEAAFNGFFRAVGAGEDRLASSEEDWQRLMPLTGARNLAELKKVRDAFRSGIPKNWGPGGQSDATKLFHLLSEELDDQQLTGRSKEIAPGTFFFGRT